MVSSCQSDLARTGNPGQDQRKSREEASAMKKKLVALGIAATLTLLSVATAFANTGIVWGD